MASERWWRVWALPRRERRPRLRWRITEPWWGEGWIARAVPEQWLRLKLYRQRRENIESLWWGIGSTVFGVLWTVGTVLLSAAVPDTEGWDWLWVGFIAGMGAGFAALGSAAVMASARGLRPARDRIWVDDEYLLWIRWHPGTYRAEPSRVAVADVVEVRLAEGDRAVVVRTEDGVDHPVTDLGTASERIGLATAIGAVIGPGATRVHPEQPPWLPLLWCRRRTDDGTALTWRRPVPGYRWTVLAAAFVAAVGLAGAPGPVLTPLVLLYLPAVGGLCYWVVTAFKPTGTGWLVRAGRLDAVRVETRTGVQVGIPDRVAALELRRRAGCVRVHARFDDGKRRRVASGWRNRKRITGFARWLADRADVSLEHERASAWAAGCSTGSLLVTSLMSRQAQRRRQVVR